MYPEAPFSSWKALEEQMFSSVLTPGNDTLGPVTAAGWHNPARAGASTCPHCCWVLQEHFQCFLHNYLLGSAGITSHVITVQIKTLGSPQLTQLTQEKLPLPDFPSFPSSTQLAFIHQGYSQAFQLKCECCKPSKQQKHGSEL